MRRAKPWSSDAARDERTVSLVAYRKFVPCRHDTVCYKLGSDPTKTEVKGENSTEIARFESTSRQKDHGKSHYWTAVHYISYLIAPLCSALCCGGVWVLESN